MIRLLLDISRTPDGRLEGRIRTEGTDGTASAASADAWRPFSGVLELLKVVEEHT